MKRDLRFKKTILTLFMALSVTIAGMLLPAKAMAATTSETGLYYNQLNSTEKKIYNKLLADATYKHPYASLSLSTSLSYDYAKAGYAALYDHPELFPWNDGRVGYSGSYGASTISLTINLGKISAYGSTMNSKFNSALNQVLMDMTATSTYGRVLYFHDWLTKKCHYDQSLSTTYAHSPAGCLIKKTGVCESYAKAFKALCDRVDIPCLIISGENHAWNYVKMSDGLWYMVDATFDDPIVNGGDTTGRHDYFLISNRPAIYRHNPGMSFGLKAVSTSSKNYSGSKSLKITKAPVLTRDGNKSITVTWSKVKASAGYQVYRKASNESKYSRVKTTSSRKFVDTDIKKGVKCTYKVRSYMKIGTSKKYFHYTNTSTK